MSHTATAILGIRTGSVVRDHLLRFAAHDMERETLLPVIKETVSDEY